MTPIIDPHIVLPIIMGSVAVAYLAFSSVKAHSQAEEKQRREKKLRSDEELRQREQEEQRERRKRAEEKQRREKKLRSDEELRQREQEEQRKLRRQAEEEQQELRRRAEEEQRELRRRAEEEQRELRRRAEEEQQIIESAISQVDSMTGQEFENLLSLCFTKLGHLVILTPASQDFGADLILRMNNAKFVVQAKRSNRPVGVNAVQEVVAAVNHYDAHKGIVITNNRFTRNARLLAQSNSIDLYDRNHLINLMVSAQSR